MASIRLNRIRDRIEVSFAFSHQTKDRVKAVGGARFDWDEKVWHFPTSRAAALLEALVPYAFVPDEETLALAEGQRPEEPEHGGITVAQLNARAAAAVATAFDGPVRIVAEIEDFRGSQRGGHAFFSLVDREGSEIGARVRAVAFRDAFRRISAELDKAGLEMENGLVIAVTGDVTIYPRTGAYQVVLKDVDADWTRRQLESRRDEVLSALRGLGLATRNLELPLPIAPQRIALVTSEGSDAYHDVLDSLRDSGFGFEVTVFDVRVQGEHLERGVTGALHRIHGHHQAFDVCLIVRGGGSRTELGGWNNLPVARAVALLPVPVVVGIGHEQDGCVLDDIARSTRTPTAAAALLVDQMLRLYGALSDCEQRLNTMARRKIDYASTQLRNRGLRVELASRRRFAELRSALFTVLPERLGRTVEFRTQKEKSELERRAERIAPAALRRPLDSRAVNLETSAARLRLAADARLAQHERVLGQQHETLAELASRRVADERRETTWRERSLEASRPERLLKRGFAILRGSDGRIADPSALTKGEAVEIETSAVVVHADVTRIAARDKG